MGNMLQMTPQGRAMGAMQPPMQPPQGMKKGGSLSDKSTAQMKQEIENQAGENGKRMVFNAEGPGGVRGINVPRHMWEGGKKVSGMKDINVARAQVYGAENRDPLDVGQIGKIHQNVLNSHFAKPLEQQIADEGAALNRLRAAKHISGNANTLDESEKLDTVRHEHDPEGRTYIGYASKGVAGHSLYTSGSGKNQRHHIVNTCPGQTAGCGGGTDKNGIVDTRKGTCFAPNAESQYAGAAVRRACHEQAKHDPAMTEDWILAHTGSLRHAARLADKNNQVLLFRPNVVDETDTSSRYAIKHLNNQRRAENRPMIIANSYGKTNELHDPANGYFVTYSNVGPKVKHGQQISVNIGRDKQRVRSTVAAQTAAGRDFINDEGMLTPPKNSYMVTDVKRDTPLSNAMQQAFTHAKYWGTGRSQKELSEQERSEGHEGHFDANGRSTTPEKAHYGHITLPSGLRYDYQKQHILHPRLVQVGFNKDGSPHMIPTDSRFKDEEFLPKDRFMTKNGKKAGAILMTTPTTSTSGEMHHTSFTHHVNPKHIEHAMQNNGEYEIDNPFDQETASGKEYIAPKVMKRFAHGGSVSHGASDDNFLANPETNGDAQAYLARRMDPEEIHEIYGMQAFAQGGSVKSLVRVSNDLDVMQYELTMKGK
jgi:hypothetical protein